jgi:hypothetical protein
MPDGELGQTDAADELDLRALLGQPSDEGQSAMEEPIPQGAAAASADDNRPVEGRAQILSAFKRGAPQPEPQPRQPPPPPRPAEKPWFAGEREQPQPQHELSEAAVDEFVDSSRAGDAEISTGPGSYSATPLATLIADCRLRTWGGIARDDRRFLPRRLRRASRPHRRGDGEQQNGGRSRPHGRLGARHQAERAAPAQPEDAAGIPMAASPSTRQVI